VGASFEGYFVESLALHLGARPEECFFWRTHAGAELDLLVIHRGRRFGFELKHSEAPAVSRSMRVALEALGLARLWIVVPGGPAWELEERIAVTPLAEIGSAFAAAGSGVIL